MTISDRIQQAFGNPIEWKSSSKALLVLNVLLFEQLLYFFSLHWAIHSPMVSSYLELNLAQQHLEAFKYLMLGTLGSIFLVRLLRFFWKDCVLFEYIAAFEFGVAHVYYGYTIGLMSLPSGVVLAAAPVVGFIFLDRKAVIVSFCTGLLFLVALCLATAVGHIPYAPLAQNFAPVDGQILPIWVLVYCFFAAPHLFTLFAMAYYVLHRWRQREDEIRYLSTTDPLTNLHNRRSIMDHLSREQITSEANNTPLSILMVDLDYFKQINDMWGHNVGDQVLIEVANTLQSTTRQEDFVGRYGGEEFLIILPGLEKSLAQAAAERIRLAISALNIDLDPNTSLSLTTSLGLYCCPPRCKTSSHELIRRADMALYQAKDAGRDCLVVA